MKRRLVRVLFLVLVISFAISSLLVSSAQTGLPVASTPAPLPTVFDVRGPDGVPTGLGQRSLSTAQTLALQELKKEVGADMTVQYNGLTATPRHMLTHGNYLSAPNSADPETIARNFIDRWRAIFRFSDADLQNLRLKSRAKIPDMGVTVLLFGQTLGGIPIYKGEVLVNVNRAGQVISVGGDSFPHVTIINAGPITPAQPLDDGYVISAEQAITLAAAQLGVPGFTPQFAGTQKVPLTFGSAPRVYEDAPKYHRGVFTDDIVVSKVIFPLGDQARLAYKFTLTTPQHSGIMWESIVDAQTGTVLRRASLTSFQTGGGQGVGRRSTFRPDFQDLVESQNASGTAGGKVTDTMPTALAGLLGFGRSPAIGVPPSYQNPENFTPTATATGGRGFKFSQINARNEHPLIYTAGFGQVLRNFPDAQNPSPWSPFGWFYLPTDTGGAEITVANGNRTTTRDHGYNIQAGAKTRNAVNPANSPTGDGDQPFSADLAPLASPVVLTDGRTLSSVFQSRYTEGNNVVVADDHANDNEGTHGIKGYAADRKYTAPYFDYLMSYEYGGVNAAAGVFPASTHPDVFPGTATLFYYSNLIHDYLYSIGFTEELWNFQQDNFGKGGEGGDALSAQVQDGSGINNANFGTPADGGSPRMQMFLWTEDATRRADGDFDFDVVQHEYYHGVSNRSAGKGDTGCLGLGVVVQFPSEAGGQGEGWGDYQAESLTDDDVTGEFVTGEFDRGIRTLPMNNFRWSYAAINRRAFNRRDQQTPDPNTGAPSTNPTNYPVFQVHHVGTIFAPMLWDMRELLIMKQKVGASFPGVFYDGTRRLGSGTQFYIGERLVQSVDTQHPINYRESFGTHAVVMNSNNLPQVVPNVKATDIVRPGLVANEIQALGNRQGPLAIALGRGARLADTLVLRGLQLSPCNPSIVDTRDSILLADKELTGGENRAVIWRAFASHGVGAQATSTSGTGSEQGVPPPGTAATTTAPAVVEDFTVPQGVLTCEQLGPLGAPSFALSNTVDNTVTIQVTAVPGANKYIVSRSENANGPFTLVTETTGNTVNDNNGGAGLPLNTTFYYQVRASRDAEANCVSTANTQNITVTVGQIVAPGPIFSGVDRVDDPQDGSRLILSWNSATSLNPNAQIVYDVYRTDTVVQGDGTQRASFTPSSGNLIAEGVTGTSYSDTGLELANVYYYIVQARDTSTGKKDTNDVGNTVTKFNAPTSSLVTDTPPFALEDFESNSANTRFTPQLVDSGGNPNQALTNFQRVVGEAFGGLPSTGKMYAPEFSPGHEANGCNPNPGGTGCGAPADFFARIGPLTLTPTSIMEFEHAFNAEAFFDGGVIEISVGDPGFNAATPFPNNATVFDAGNFIIEGPYNDPLDGVLEEPVKLSPLQGRLAYTGVKARHKVRISLNDFAPGRPHNPSGLPVYIRFRNTSDAASANGLDAGWYVDNLTVRNFVEPPPGVCVTRTNVALSSNGSNATASSSHSSGVYPASAAVNGDRTGVNWGTSNGGWNDGTRGAYPDTFEVAFPSAQRIDEINVFTLQNGWQSGAQPTLLTSASGEGILDFSVEYWDGTNWVTVPNGSVTANDKAWRQFLLAPVVTTKIRVVITNARNNWSRLVEVEAWGCPAS